MFRKLLVSALGTAAVAVAGIAHSQEPVKIGFITTLTTPAGYIGEDQRDAFNLAIKQGQGNLGGVPVNLIVEDDALKPSNGKQLAEKMLQDGVKLFTGINFSNVLTAVAPTVLRRDGFYVSVNPGPSPFAGDKCDANYFVASYENTTIHAAAGEAASQMGYKRMAVLAPNYQAGRDAIQGFKRGYKGEIISEMYTKLDQNDFSVELARLRDLKPDAIYQFHPGGAGINFAKQFATSGLGETMPVFLPVFSMDLRMIDATGDAASDLYTTALWSPLLDNPANKAFVEAFQKEYGRMPTHYAALAFDTANLIASALKEVNGDLSKADEFRAALRKADFDSVRGNFAFGPNQHPVQDYYLTQLKPQADGRLLPEVVRTVSTGVSDPFAAECKL